MSRSIIILSSMAVAMVPGAAGIQHFSSSKIIDLSPEVLPTDLEDSDEAWKKAQEKLKNEASTNLITSFKNLQDALKKSNSPENSDQTGKYMKSLCINLYQWHFGSIFNLESRSTENTRLNQVQKYCFVSIKEKLTNTFDGSTDEDDKKQKISEKLTALRGHKSNEQNKNLQLDQKLEDLSKSSDSSDANAWKELRKWCQDKYTKGYRGPQHPLWKLTNTYCTYS